MLFGTLGSTRAARSLVSQCNKMNNYLNLQAGLLLMEGVYVISGEAYATKIVRRKNRIRIHWILNLTGLVLLAIGVSVIILHKESLNEAHFSTIHSILGLTTFILSLCVASFGLMANNGKYFYPRIRPVLLKVVHAFGGIGVSALLLITLVNGTFNHWWTAAPSAARYGTDDATATGTGVDASKTWRALILASLAVAALLVLIKPIIGAVARSRLLCSPTTVSSLRQSSTASTTVHPSAHPPNQSVVFVLDEDKLVDNPASKTTIIAT